MTFGGKPLRPGDRAERLTGVIIEEMLQRHHGNEWAQQRLHLLASLFGSIGIYGFSWHQPMSISVSLNRRRSMFNFFSEKASSP